LTRDDRRPFVISGIEIVLAVALNAGIVLETVEVRAMIG